MMEKQNNIPKLRFPEFSDAWEVKKLGEVAKFSKGKGISKADISENGETECIRYGELYTVYKETINEIKSRTNIDIKDLVLSEANDVIIPASGETQIDIATASCVLKSGIALGGDLNIIKTNNNGVFLSYLLNSAKKQDIANLAQGVSVVHLYSSQLATLKISFPNLPEQQKIDTFLSTIDKKLQALKKKKSLLETYKKGVMQKFFSQQIRFKDDEGNNFEDWEVKKLGEIIQIQSSKRVLQEDWKDKGIPFYRTREIINLSNGDDFRTPIFIDEKLFEQIKLKYGIPKAGDMLVTGVGTIGETYIVKKDDKFYFKDGNVLWFKLNEKICSKFLNQAFKTKYIKRQLSDNASITTVATFTIDGAKKTIINLPSLPEQTKIANFLTAIDEKINKVDTQIKQTELWKKGLLQQMFV